MKPFSVFLCFGCLGIGFACGLLVQQSHLFSSGQGTGNDPASADGDKRAARSPAATQSDIQLAKLRTLGYLSGYENAPESSGVLLHDPAQSYAGYNLYSTGAAPEATLLDMEGKVLHSWDCALNKVWPGREIPVVPAIFWERVHLYDNGDLLAIYSQLGLVKIDRHSNLIWDNPINAHHDFEILENGTIYVLSSKKRPHRLLENHKQIVEQFVTIVNPSGQVLREISLVDAFGNSEFRSLLSLAPQIEDDIFHANTLEVLDGRLEAHSPAFKSGNVLVSLRNNSWIAVVDVDEEKVVWALSGMWLHQHRPSVLANGHMLLFDNVGQGNYSRVIEFDPFSQKVFWQYDGGEQNRLNSPVMGSCARLPNGNTLITESTFGRALEVTPQKQIVWKFQAPQRTGYHNDQAAAIPELQRLEPDIPLDWIE